MNWITIVGTLATVAGAVLSFWQAKISQNAAKASISAAKDAKKVRAELIDHRKASELSQIQTTCRKAQKSMEKYGPGSSPSSLIGVSPEKDAQDVQEFVLLLMENRVYFGNETSNDADDFCEKIYPLLDKFAQSQDAEPRKHGRLILLLISEMTSVIKKLLDAKREDVH